MELERIDGITYKIKKIKIFDDMIEGGGPVCCYKKSVKEIENKYIGDYLIYLCEEMSDEEKNIDE